MNMKLKFGTLVGLAGCMVFGSAIAGPYNGVHPLQSDRFKFAFGGFFSELDGDIYLDPANIDHEFEVDLQDDLGVDDSQVLPAAGLIWRYSNNGRLQGEYFSVGQDTKHTLDASIEWGDLDFAVGAKVKSDFDMDIVRAFWGYSLFKDERKELGVGVGIHYLNIEVSLKGNATINSTPVLNAKRGIDNWAILPNVGAFGNYAFSPKWIAFGRVDWISANIDDYSGGLWNLEAAIQYQAFEHAGIGLAYRYVNLNLDANKGRGDWGGDLDYSGPLLFFTMNY